MNNSTLHIRSLFSRYLTAALAGVNRDLSSRALTLLRRRQREGLLRSKSRPRRRSVKPLGWLVLVRGGATETAEFCLDTTRRSHSPSGGWREGVVLSELTPWWFALFVYSWMDTSAPGSQHRGSGPLCYLLICQAHVTGPVNGLQCDDSEWPLQIEVILHLPTSPPGWGQPPASVAAMSS